MPALVALVVLFAAPASAEDVTSETCGPIWARYFTPEPVVASSASSPLFRAADRIASLGRAEPREVVVASCVAGAPRTSTIDVWFGEYAYDEAGNRVAQGTCTTVDVIEVQGRKCRRFPTSRICQHVSRPDAIQIAVGDSYLVPCP